LNGKEIKEKLVRNVEKGKEEGRTEDGKEEGKKRKRDGMCQLGETVNQLHTRMRRKMRTEGQKTRIVEIYEVAAMKESELDPKLIHCLV
jgi:hypothetical protein